MKYHKIKKKHYNFISDDKIINLRKQFFNDNEFIIGISYKLTQLNFPYLLLNAIQILYENFLSIKLFIFNSEQIYNDDITNKLNEYKWIKIIQIDKKDTINYCKICDLLVLLNNENSINNSIILKEYLFSEKYILYNSELIFEKDLDVNNDKLIKFSNINFGKDIDDYILNDNIQSNKISLIIKQLELNIKNVKYDLCILTTYDWCNTGYRYMKSLIQNNLKVQMIKIFTNTCFIYPHQSLYLYEDINDKRFKNDVDIIKTTVPYYHFRINNKNISDLIKKMIKSSNNIYLHAESYIELYDFDYKDKNIITGVSGHPYRRQPKEYSEFFNTFCNKSLIQCPDLLYKGLNNEHLIYYGVDTDLIKFNNNNNYSNILNIGHFSSNAYTKGSDIIYSAILKILNLYPKKYKYIGETFENMKLQKHHYNTWTENIKRYNNCDIYIETCKPYLNSYLNFTEYNNTPYGEWGNTCLEAAASGCIVITNSLTYNYYINEYTTNYPLLIANNEDEIINHLKNLSSMSIIEINQLKFQFRKWVEDNHSLIKTGERFINKLITN